MKLIILIAFLSITKCDPILPNIFTEIIPNTNVIRGMVISRVDHFNPQDPRVFAQRIYGMESFVREWSPPIFIYISGTWDNVSPTFFLQNGHMFDIAYNLGAAIYSIEYRYFSESWTTT